MALETLVDVFKVIPGLSNKEAVRETIGYRTNVVSYGQVYKRVAALSSYLMDEGLKKGEHVLLWGENCHEWLVAFWACVVRGIIVVPIDYRFSLTYVQRIQEEVQARMIVHGQDIPAGEDILAGFSKRLPFPQIDDIKGPDDIVYEQTGQDDIVEIVYTSGTTGTPKGVVHRHSNISANLRPLAREFAQYKWPLIPVQPIRVMNTLPLSHMFGQALGLFIPVLLRGSVVFVNSHHPRRLMETIKDERVTALVSVPRLLNQLQAYIDQGFPQPPCSLKGLGFLNVLANIWRFRKLHSSLGWKFWVVVAGGAHVRQDMERWWSQRGFLIVQGYGLTEASPIVSLNHPFHVTQGSLGKVIEGNEVKIAPDGEILVRGQSISSQYTGKQNGMETTSEGWFHTGDLGEIDQKGNLFYKGRKKDVIVTPEGYNVFPSDIEEALNSFDQVRESVVVGLEIEDKTRIQAVLRMEDGKDEEASRIIQKANQVLEPYQRIQGWTIWPEEDFPRTPSTLKVKRGEVAARVGRSLADKGHEPERPHFRDEDKVLDILGQIIGSRSEQIRDEHLLADDLGLSSLDALELIVQLEHGFGISLDEAQISNIRTVGELKDWVTASQGRDRASRPASTVHERSTSFTRQEPSETVSKTRQGDLISIPKWPRSFPVRIVRAVMLSLIIIPIARRIMGVNVKNRLILESVSGPVILAANHASHLDTLAILMALPFSWRCLVAPGARQEHFQARFSPGDYRLKDRLKANLQYFLGSLIFNLFPLSQKMGGTRRVLHHMGQLVKMGFCPLIYPEGRFSPDGTVQPFQQGIGLMAKSLQLSVVPVYISGTRELLSPGRKWPSRGKVTVCFGHPLALEKESDVKNAAQKVEESVKSFQLSVRSSETES